MGSLHKSQEISNTQTKKRSIIYYMSYCIENCAKYSSESIVSYSPYTTEKYPSVLWIYCRSYTSYRAHFSRRIPTLFSRLYETKFYIVWISEDGTKIKELYVQQYLISYNSKVAKKSRLVGAQISRRFSIRDKWKILLYLYL